MKRRGFLGLLTVAPVAPLLVLSERPPIKNAAPWGAFSSAEATNIAVGSNALSCLTTGEDNVAIGCRSLYDITTGGHGWRWPGKQ